MNNIFITNQRTPFALIDPIRIAKFKIDRSSPIGNPFVMQNEAERDLVCDQYEQYFYKTLEEGEGADAPFINYLYTILVAFYHSDIVLECWCAPKRCHGETIKKWLEKEST